MQGLSSKSFISFLSGILLVSLWGCLQKPPTIHTVEESTLATEDKTLQACKLCHSNREMQRGPVLDGMEEWYLLDQLQKFKTGLRGQQDSNRAEILMATAMKDVSPDPETLLSLAQAFATLPPQPSLTTIKGNAERGQQLYQSCANCHGVDAKGKPEVKAPGLRIQEDWFLLDQLRKYKLGLRGTDPEDTFGNVMATAVMALDDQDLKDLVVYLDSIN
jgi:cytochrome c553